MPYLLYSIIIKINNLLKEEVRNEIAQKKQYCEEAFKLYDKFEKFEYEINSKEIQTTPETRNIKTQTSFIKKNVFSVISKRILKCTLVKMN